MILNSKSGHGSPSIVVACKKEFLALLFEDGYRPLYVASGNMLSFGRKNKEPCLSGIFLIIATFSQSARRLALSLVFRRQSGYSYTRRQRYHPTENSCCFWNANKHAATQ